MVLNNNIWKWYKVFGRMELKNKEESISQYLMLLLNHMPQGRYLPSKLSFIKKLTFLQKLPCSRIGMLLKLQKINVTNILILVIVLCMLKYP